MLPKATDFGVLGGFALTVVVAVVMLAYGDNRGMYAASGAALLSVGYVMGRTAR